MRLSNWGQALDSKKGIMWKKIVCSLIFFLQRLLLKLQQFRGRYLKKGGRRVPGLCQCKELLVLGRALWAFHLQQHCWVGSGLLYPSMWVWFFFFLFSNVLDPFQVSKYVYCCLLKVDLSQQSNLWKRIRASLFILDNFLGGLHFPLNSWHFSATWEVLKVRLGLWNLCFVSWTLSKVRQEQEFCWQCLLPVSTRSVTVMGGFGLESFGSHKFFWVFCAFWHSSPAEHCFAREALEKAPNLTDGVKITGV